MEVDDIVEALGEAEKKRFTVRKTLRVGTSLSKSLKWLRVELWDYDKQKVLLAVEKGVNAAGRSKRAVMSDLDKEFMVKLFKWVKKR